VELPPPVLAVELVEPVFEAPPEEVWCFAAGLGMGFRAGTATAAPSAVTEACGAGTETAGASEAPACGEELDLVSAPRANAIPNATTAARISISQRFLTAA